MAGLRPFVFSKERLSDQRIIELSQSLHYIFNHSFDVSHRTGLFESKRRCSYEGDLYIDHTCGLFPCLFQKPDDRSIGFLFGSTESGYKKLKTFERKNRFRKYGKTSDPSFLYPLDVPCGFILYPFPCKNIVGSNSSSCYVVTLPFNGLHIVVDRID